MLKRPRPKARSSCPSLSISTTAVPPRAPAPRRMSLVGTEQARAAHGACRHRARRAREPAAGVAAVELDLRQRRHRFRADEQYPKGLPADAGGALPARPSGDRHRAGLDRWHAQMAVPLSRSQESASCRRSRSRPSISRKRIAARCASSSQVGCTLTCSFCHTGTQKLVRNLTAGEILGQILMARERIGDFPGGSPADRWRARPAPPRRQRGRQPRHHQCGDDGHGRAALQLRQRQERASDRLGRRRRRRYQQAPHHAFDLGRRAADRAVGPRGRHDARDLAPRGARRSARHAGADQQEVAARRAARGRARLSAAFATPSASPSNM